MNEDDYRFSQYWNGKVTKVLLRHKSGVVISRDVLPCEPVRNAKNEMLKQLTKEVENGIVK